MYQFQLDSIVAASRMNNFVDDAFSFYNENANETANHIPATFPNDERTNEKTVIDVDGDTYQLTRNIGHFWHYDYVAKNGSITV